MTKAIASSHHVATIGLQVVNITFEIFETLSNNLAFSSENSLLPFSGFYDVKLIYVFPESSLLMLTL